MSARPFAPQQRVQGMVRQHAEPNQLRTKLVPDVHRVRGCLFEVQPHLGHGVGGGSTDAGGRVLLGALFLNIGGRVGILRSGHSRSRQRRRGARPVVASAMNGPDALLEEDG